jgi:hypothetical protein
MNLPAYSNLQYPSNAIYAGQGIRGMFSTPEVANAFEAACQPGFYYDSKRHQRSLFLRQQ